MLLNKRINNAHFTYVSFILYSCMQVSDLLVLPWKSDPVSGANRRHTTHLIVGAVQGNSPKELDRKAVVTLEATLYN